MMHVPARTRNPVRIAAAALVVVLLAGVAQAHDGHPTPPDPPNPDYPHSASCKLDVDIVIDISGSMGISAGPGMTRLDVAKAGASTFLGSLSTVKDRSAAVAFSNSNAHLRLNGFTYAHTTTDGNIAGLRPTGGTFPASAIGDSHENFLVNGRPDARWLMVFLADGAPSDRAASLAAGEAAKDDGIEIITIQAFGGSDTFMRDLASDPVDWYAKKATNRAEVLAAWDEISRDVFQICAEYEHEAFCHEEPVFFEDLSVSPYGGDPIDKIYWDMGDGHTYGPMTPRGNLTHDYEAPGSYEVTLRVFTTNGLEADVTQTVDVCNNAPDVLGPSEVFVVAGRDLSFHLDFIDRNGDPVTLRAAGPLLPDMTYSTDGFRVFWPTSQQDLDPPGPRYKVTFAAVDIWGASTEKEIDVIVMPPATHAPGPRDADGDGIADGEDNCPWTWNPYQEDGNEDGTGHQCDEAGAGGGLGTTNGGSTVSSGKEPRPGEATGEALTTSGSDEPEDVLDSDGDRIVDARDLCPFTFDPLQRDVDGDAMGDACDADIDGDGIPQVDAVGRTWDNCPYRPNADQADADHDGVGDVCANDPDGDGVPTRAAGARMDNCPDLPNPDQADADGDGIGDACEALDKAETQEAVDDGHAAKAASQASVGSMLAWSASGVLLLLAAVLVLVVLRRR